MSLVNQVYGRLPVFAQDLAISVFGLKYRRQRLGPGFDDYVAGFVERESWSADKMQDYVTERLRFILRLAFLAVPYYRARWSDAGIEERDLAVLTPSSLPYLPTTPKEDLRSDPDSLVSTTLPTGARLLRQRTSGSTGTPTTVWTPARDYRRFMAAREARSFGWAGVSIRMPRATIGSRLVVPDARSNGPFYRRNLAERQLYLSATHLSPENLPDYLKGLNRFKPKVLTGYAHSHYLLARLMLESGSRLDYRPLAAILGSEKITPQMRRVMAEAFGTGIFEEYGSVENCVLATECKRGNLHVSPDFGILEILDDQDQPVGPGEIGRLVCTGLLNETQPLVRYEIGDLGAWSSQGCPCGRSHMPVLEGIVGRVRDVVLMRDGRRITLPTGPIFAAVQGVIEGQIVQQDYDDFVIRVVATADFGPRESSQLGRQLKHRVGDVRITVQSVGSLEKTSAGKSKAVISRVLDHESESA